MRKGCKLADLNSGSSACRVSAEIMFTLDCRDAGNVLTFHLVMIASYQWFGSAVCLLMTGWICAGAPFANVTRESGVAEAMTRHYETHPRWCLSGVNFIDLDGDVNLDLFLSAHGAGAPLALLGD